MEVEPTIVHFVDKSPFIILLDSFHSFYRNSTCVDHLCMHEYIHVCRWKQSKLLSPIIHTHFFLAKVNFLGSGDHHNFWDAYRSVSYRLHCVTKVVFSERDLSQEASRCPALSRRFHLFRGIQRQISMRCFSKTRRSVSPVTTVPT